MCTCVLKGNSMSFRPRVTAEEPAAAGGRRPAFRRVLSVGMHINDGRYNMPVVSFPRIQPFGTYEVALYGFMVHKGKAIHMYPFLCLEENAPESNRACKEISVQYHEMYEHDKKPHQIT